MNKRTDAQNIIICTMILLLLIFLCIYTETRYIIAKILLFLAWCGLVKITLTDLGGIKNNE